jgi:hypothetical protein
MASKRMFAESSLGRPGIKGGGVFMVVDSAPIK